MRGNSPAMCWAILPMGAPWASIRVYHRVRPTPGGELFNTIGQIRVLFGWPAFTDALTLYDSVAARNHLGGTAPAQVRATVVRVRAELC
jgi:hypothetical protein